MEIILLCLYGKVTVIVIFLIIYLYWIWKKVRLIKWEQAPGDTRDWIRNHEKNINKIIKIISGIGFAIGGLHQTVLRSKTDAMRSERTKLIQL